MYCYAPTICPEHAMDHRHTSRIAAGPPASGPVPTGSGLPVKKIALGCGCLLVLLLLLGVGGGAALWYFGGTALEEVKAEFGLDKLPVSMDEAQRIIEAAEEATPSSSGAGASDEARTLEPKEVRAALAKPLTKTDVKAYRGLIEELRASEPYRRWGKETESLKAIADKTKGGGEASTVDGLRAIRGATKSMEAGADLMKTFDALVRGDGGYLVYMERVVRVSGVTAAAQQVASQMKEKDAASDAVAARLLKERPEVRAELEKNRKEFKRLKAKGDAQAGMAMLAMQQPGTVALARMPEASFKLWKALPQSTRRELLELQKPKADDLPMLFIGAPVHRQALIVTAEMQAPGEE